MAKTVLQRMFINDCSLYFYFPLLCCIIFDIISSCLLVVLYSRIIEWCYSKATRFTTSWPFLFAYFLMEEGVI